MCGGLVDAQLLKDVREFFPPLLWLEIFESKAFVWGGGGGGGSNSHTIFVKIPLQFVMSGPNQMGLSTCDQHFCLELWGNWIRYMGSAIIVKFRARLSPVFMCILMS